MHFFDQYLVITLVNCLANALIPVNGITILTRLPITHATSLVSSVYILWTVGIHKY